MTESGERVNNDAASEQAAPAAPRNVSATAVLLSAVELAQTRGAFKMNEMTLITQAYNMVLGQEQQRAAAATAAAASTTTTEE